MKGRMERKATSVNKRDETQESNSHRNDYGRLVLICVDTESEGSRKEGNL